MFYDSELSFLCDVFQRSRVQTTVLPQAELQALTAKKQSTDNVEELFSAVMPRQAPVHALAHQTVYKLTDALDRHYLYLLLPHRDIHTILVVGPYLSVPMTAERALMIGETAGFSPLQHRTLSEYFLSLPILSDGCQLMTMFYTFCELLWQNRSFSIIELEHSQQESERPLSATEQNHNLQDTLMSMKTMEQRYAFENEIIHAVSHGRLHIEEQLFSVFSNKFFEMRVADPLRNAKNYNIIMNTLLRKAAENGGVHPIHINRVSSEFAAKIEAISSTAEIPTLMSEMFRTYCRLVHKHSVQSYSRLIQRTITLIASDLSADLSPKMLAVSQGVSAGYLSTVFKRETGKTLSEYIREKRMEHAAHLLRMTDLQIQTVALHSGIMDIQYFSKLFKKQLGMTPTEYRLSRRQAGQV